MPDPAPYGGLTTGTFQTEQAKRPRDTEEAAKAACPLLEEVRVYWRGERLLLELWFVRVVTPAERADVARVAAAAVKAWIGPDGEDYRIRARKGRPGVATERRDLPWLEP